MELLLVNAPGGRKAGVECRAGPCAGVAVSPASAITIIIPNLLVHADVHGIAAVIAPPYVSVNYFP
jgi:hypothetical protein